VTKVAVQCLSAIPPRLGGPGDTDLGMHPAASEVRDGVPPRSLLVEVCVLGLAIRASVVRPLPYPTVGQRAPLRLFRSLNPIGFAWMEPHCYLLRRLFGARKGLIGKYGFMVEVGFRYHGRVCRCDPR